MATKRISIQNLNTLLREVRDCSLCKPYLPLGPRPVLSMESSARILVIGQAPGTRVHETGIPWNDPSGERLRQWMGVTEQQFYDAGQIAIMPMGFCYPGKGKSGDMPPRPECAPHWHDRLREQLPNVRLTLLIGRYAQQYYLTGGPAGESLSSRVARYQDFLPDYFVLPHPSPRNRRWMAQRPWFEQEVIPALQSRLASCL